MLDQEELVRNTLMNKSFVDALKENIAPFMRLMTFYRCALMEVETKFRVLNEEFSLEYDRNPIESIKTRLKGQESLARKMMKQGLPITVSSIEENINDVAGIRIICSFREDIYRLADCLLAQDDVRLIERKDYIKYPKPSGYRSLHLIIEVPIFLQNEKRRVKVEVQLRTIAMDFWASLEHKLRYKKEIPPEEAEEIAEELMRCAQMSEQLDDKMEAIKERVEK